MNGNARSVDEIKIINKCEICKTEYTLPIDAEYKYKLNDFIPNILFGQNSLPVLWVLGFLRNSNLHSSFYYLPEVDLYTDSKNKQEIDILCVLKGRFYVGEVKKSVANFTNEDEIQKFIDKIEAIKPDVALLAFEKYCDDEGSIESEKQKLADAVKTIKTCKVKNLEVKAFVASDFPHFSDYAVDFGYTGKRTYDLFSELEKQRN